MSSERHNGVEAARSPNQVLVSATQRILDRIGELFPLLTPGGAVRAEGYLVTLRVKVEEVIGGRDPEPVREWIARSPLYGPIMDALNDELLNSTPEADASSAIVVLRAVSALRGRQVSSRPTSDANPDDVRARMRGPDAFELLIEVAHDFRSPLTSILFLAEALRDGHSGPVTDLQRSQLGLMYSAAFGLASIASDVMDLAREEKDLTAGGAELFSLVEPLRQVERMVRPIVEEKGLELRVVGPDRWQGRGHPHALSRVLLNLTTNALKFTDEGTVELGVKPLPHGRVEYYVQDTGRGITPEQQKVLFQPFRRRTSKPEEGHYFSGSGIGLSIARRLLQAMGSDLSLDTSDARGTRFSFVLPANLAR